jgi:GNAT superfamily N-acetyltransferase
MKAPTHRSGINGCTVLRRDEQPLTRLARLSDAASIAGFNLAHVKEVEPDVILNKRETLKGVRAVLKNPNLGFYLVAEAESRVIGVLMITKEWSDWRNQFYWWIGSVYVAPGSRQQGVFRSLYHRANQLAQKANAHSLKLYTAQTNRRAHRVYKSVGMKEQAVKVFHKSLNK